MKLKAAILLLVVFMFVAAPSALAAEQYLTTGWAKASEQLYKGIPINWWSVYHIKEFDKVAPNPGADWMSGHDKRSTTAATVFTWVTDAKKKGWVVKTLATDAWPGAMAVKVNTEEKLAQVYFVREVQAWGIVGSYINKDGEPATGRISFDDLRSNKNGYYFQGYIWPMKQDEYDANKEKYDNELINRLMAKETFYKGYKDSWSGTWIIKEFDKLAPAPGFNWRGSAHDWVKNAETAGWKVSYNPGDAKPGSILLRSDRSKDLVWLLMVREVRGDRIVGENRSGKVEIKLSELLQKNFVGYIFSERQ